MGQIVNKAALVYVMAWFQNKMMIWIELIVGHVAIA